MTKAPDIPALQTRHDAEHLAQGFASLLADAHLLAASISVGAHGRRRSGAGEEFWQYRTAVQTDAYRDIDWRRSARSEDHYIRQHEWQNTQSVHLWVDRGASMLFRSQKTLPQKAERAVVLGLAICILLSKAGEKVGLTDFADPPKHGALQIENMAAALAKTHPTQEFNVPAQKEMKQGHKAVFMSDFLGDWDQIFANLSHAANQNVDGYLMQILDPIEEDFPFMGRTVLFSMTEGHKFETLRAQSLRDEYRDKLAERQSALKQLAKNTDWKYCQHKTSEPAITPLLWLYQMLGGQN